MIKYSMRPWPSLLPLLPLFLLAAGDSAGGRDIPFQDMAALRAGAARHLLDQARREYPDAEATLEVGSVDARLRMPGCDQLEYFLPPGTRLFGNGSLGVRCQTPSPWSLYLSFHMQLKGNALVTTRPLGARQAIGPADVEVRQVDYAAAPGEYLRLPAQAAGAVTARPLPAGQALTQDTLLPMQTVRAGQRVQAVVEGTGFRISHEGIALNSATPGQVVRLRTASGQVIQGVATAEGQVRIGP